jgi:hypothetical protein
MSLTPKYNQHLNNTLKRRSEKPPSLPDLGAIQSGKVLRRFEQVLGPVGKNAQNRGSVLNTVIPNGKKSDNF